MKWIFRSIVAVFFIVLLYSLVLVFFGYRIYSAETISAKLLSWKTVKPLITPLRYVPYINDRLKFIDAGIELISDITPFIPASRFLTDGITSQDILNIQQVWPAFQTHFQTICRLYPNEPEFIRSKIPSELPSLCRYVDKNPAHLQAASEIIENLPLLTGQQKSMHYIVLFQNNMELRPTGGFMGSYADIIVNQGKLEKFFIQDIYVPDGQIKGYVKEPLPIKKYLFNDNHPGWRLRDANWHPDFTQAGKALDWFFTEGKVDKADGFIGVNLQPILDLLKSSHGIYIADYDLTITAENFYQEAQRHAEQNFFPGSTQKGNFLRSLGNTLRYQLETSPSMIKAVLPSAIKALDHKHLFINVPSAVMPTWKNLGWDGSLHSYTSDYLMINEANLGSNKANCCINRSLSDEISIKDGLVRHRLVISYKNNNPAKPAPPLKWGGGYKNFLRLITPPKTVVDSVKVNGKQIKDIYSEDFETGYMGNGFLVLTEGGQQSTVEVEYSVPFRGPESDYSLYFQKQSGVENWPAVFTIQNRQYTHIIESDMLIKPL